MEIERPKELGEYKDREFDCARALRPTFDQEMHSAGRTFLDLHSIAAKLMDRALSAGWTEEDVEAAVIKLASNHQASGHEIRRVAAAD